MVNILTISSITTLCRKKYSSNLSHIFPFFNWTHAHMYWANVVTVFEGIHPNCSLKEILKLCFCQNEFIWVGLVHIFWRHNFQKPFSSHKLVMFVISWSICPLQAVPVFHQSTCSHWQPPHDYSLKLTYAKWKLPFNLNFGQFRFYTCKTILCHDPQVINMIILSFGNGILRLSNENKQH